VTATDPLPGLIGTGAGPTKPPAPRAARPPDEPDAEAGASAADAELTEMEATRQDLYARLAETVALLKVIPHKMHDGSECFQLEMYSRNGYQAASDRAALEHQGRPGFVLAEKLVGNVDPAVVEECYDELLDWSHTKFELNSWLTELRRDIGDDLQLIIWDDTDFGIVWELFWHEMDESRAWLGTAAEIIHWITVQDPERHRQFSAQKSLLPGGSVLYYEQSTLVPDNHSICDDPEKPGFNGNFYIKCTAMNDLLDELDKDNPGQYGLVYIRGDGEHSNLRREAKIAGVSLMKISNCQLHALRGSRTLVFLNACNSARPVSDPAPGDRTSRNFTEVFLRRHATGVVATLAEVDVAYSARLSQKLIAQALAGGVRIPEFLRAERVHEARELPKSTRDLSTDEQQKILSFLRVSMFAYYGHPESVFKLAAP
jgi:hypothetical protein